MAKHDVEKLDYDFYGLPVYRVDGAEYAYAADDEAADAACKAYIEETLWAFRASVILQFLGICEPAAVKCMEEMQGKLCENANPLIRAMIGARLDEFAKWAVEADGRGAFLSSYDGEEREPREIDGWPKKLQAGYVYRTN